jgi:tetratricopeptide (TPR) repeat protein
MGETKVELTDNMVNQPGKEILFAHFASNLLKSGELDAAIKVCAMGLKKFPTYAQAHYILARCYIRKKLNDEARAELERVLRYEPSHIRAIRDLAGLYFANEFQDLYKEYLMQLFTLDPMNAKVIDEAKKLGEYKLWSAQTAPSLPTEPVAEVEKEVEYKDEKEDVFIETEKDKPEKPDPDPIFPDKIDLSQFDNVEDDFTTILHGKMEYSRQLSQPTPDEEPDLVDIAKDIIEESDLIDETKATPDENQMGPSLDDSKKSEEADQEKKASEGIQEKPATTSTAQEMDSMSEKDTSTDIEESLTNASDKISPDLESINEDDMNSDEYPDEEDGKFEQPKIISQTLGEILVSQQKYVEAKAVFEALKEKQPENKALDLKIEYLNRIIGLEKEGKS